MQPYEKETCCSVEEVFLRYGSMLYRIAVVMLQSTHDAEDVVQDTLIRYMERKKGFHDQNHEKAWLIRVTINLCKNRLLFARRHPQVELSQLTRSYENAEDRGLMECLLKLPRVHREVLLLYYVMGYSIREAAKILQVTEGAMKKRLERGRRRFKEIMEQEGAAEDGI